MSELQKALETARYELVVQNGLHCCDRVEECPHCAACERGSFQVDTTKAIELLDVQLAKFSRPMTLDGEY